MFNDEMRKAAEVYGLDLTEKQQGQFQRYYELLMEWNGKINLTAITEPREVAVKHMLDSLAGWDEKRMSGDAGIIDVGTGLTLLDSLNKRVRFLQTVVEELGLQDVTCVHGRAEEAARKEFREGFDIAVSRAVARLPVLAEYCIPFVRVGGAFLAWKGMQYQEEAEEAKKAVALLGGSGIEITRVHLPGMEDVRAILRVPKTKTTPKAYPRKAGMPVKKPLGH